jgi:hypothetical protein
VPVTFRRSQHSWRNCQAVPRRVETQERRLWIGLTRSPHDRRTAGFDATSSLPRVSEKVASPCDMRTLVVGIANQWLFDFATSGLASRLSASWMEAKVMKVARVSTRFSKSLATRRFHRSFSARPRKSTGASWRRCALAATACPRMQRWSRSMRLMRRALASLHSGRTV